MLIPQAIIETLQWLNQIEDYDLLVRMISRVEKYTDPNDIKAHDLFAMLLFKGKQYEQALKYALKVQKLAPDNIDAAYNLSRCYHAAGEPDKAEAEIQKVINANPNWIDPLLDKALYVSAQGKLEESYEILKKLYADPNLNEKSKKIIEFNLGWHLIRHNRFKEGVKNLTSGREISAWGSTHKMLPSKKLTRESNYKGKTVLIAGEGGAGDEIINIRFASILKQRGAKKIIATSLHNLDSIFLRVDGVDEVVNLKQNSPIQDSEYDFWVPMMDLPATLELNESEIPNEKFISTSNSYNEKWKKIISPNQKFKIGIRWKGNQLYERDLYRSVPFKEFLKLTEIPNIEFYSLQRDAGVEEFIPNAGVTDLSNQLQTWEDTLSAIEQLDLVITSCTSIAHLSAALGKPTWIYTPVNCYYVWAYPGTASPWYKSVSLYRQTKIKDWTEQSNQIKQDIKKIANIQTFKR